MYKGVGLLGPCTATYSDLLCYDVWMNSIRFWIRSGFYKKVQVSLSVIKFPKCLSSSNSLSEISEDISFSSLWLGAANFCYHSYSSLFYVRTNLTVPALMFSSSTVLNRQSCLLQLTLSHIWVSS
jgi:hypothetical protein